MGKYDSISGQQINVDQFCDYCDEIISSLSNQSCAYVIVSKNIESLCNDGTLKGKAIEGLQEQMLGYVTAIGALCFANEQDGTDVQTIENYLSSVKEDYLNGTEIINNINSAQSDYDDSMFMADYWWEEVRNSWNPIYIDLCGITALKYEWDASQAAKEKAKWEAKGDTLIDIMDSLSGLFVNGKVTRDLAKTGFEQISTSFDTNTGGYSFIDNSWREQLKDLAMESVIDSDGNIRWDIVDNILIKDGDSISDFEYEVLSHVYVNAEVSELNHFFTMCGKSTSPGGGVSRLEIDSVKIQNIMRQTAVLEQQLFTLVCKCDYTPDELRQVIDMRNEAIQRYTLIRQFSCSPEYWKYTNNQDGYFQFYEIEFGPHNSNNGGGRGISFTYADIIGGSGRSVYTIPRTTIISEGMSNVYLDAFATEFIDNALMGNVTLLDGIVMNNIQNTLLGEGLDKIGESLLKNGSTVIPIVGMIIGIWNDQAEESERAAKMSEAVNMNEAISVADWFGCTAVIVNSEKRWPNTGEYSYELILYPGTDTYERIQTYSQNTGIDVSNLFENPGEVFDAVLQHMKENPDALDYGQYFTTPGYNGN